MICRRACGRSGGFTLIEIILAMGIAVILLGVGAMAISSVRAQRALEDRITSIEVCARIAHTGVLRDQSPWMVVFERSCCYVAPVSSGVTKTREEGAEPPQPAHMVKFAPDEVLFMKRTAWKEWLRIDVPEYWRFEPRAILEPIEIRIESDRGWVQATFDPLTARLQDMTLEAK